MNNDGINDFVIPIFGGNFTTILFGNENGSFVDRTILFSGDTPSDAAIDDIDMDGNKDLVISHFDVSYITVFLGDGNGSFYKKKKILMLLAASTRY